MRGSRTGHRRVAGALVVVALFAAYCAVVACGSRPGAGAAAGSAHHGPAPTAITAQASSTAPTSSPSASPPRTTTAAANCPDPRSGFDCDFQRRFESVRSYLKTRPGTVGIVLRDRRTGKVWHNEHADRPVWTASTIKLAMATDLFLRERSGAITLSSDDRELIRRMLHSSDDDAADTLWFRYAGEDHMRFNDDFQRFGMTSLQPERGYTRYYPYWGFQKCTPEDLDHLINYLMTEVPAGTRDYILGQLRNVAPDQQWGVWALGPSAEPGNKDGWSKEDTGWVMNTVGFAGTGERYTLAVMNDLAGEGGYFDGRETDSTVAKILLGGRV